MKFLLSLLLAGMPVFPVLAADTDVAAKVINTFGIDLFNQASDADQNFLISPYSIQYALAMTFSGADGGTRAEMATVLHFPDKDAELQASFSALNKALALSASKSTERAKSTEPYAQKRDALKLHIANRLFGQKGYPFRKPFLEMTATGYGAPLEELDFVTEFEASRLHINEWVEKQTQEKIKDLIPKNGVKSDTRLVLTNALYLKAPWTEKFEPRATKSLPFKTAGGQTAEVPTMRHQMGYAYAKRDGFVALGVPYDTGDLQFLILLPDATDGLANLKKKLTPGLLAECAAMTAAGPGYGPMAHGGVSLELPKFKIAPPTMALADNLKDLGMTTSFDVPMGSANFDRMAPRSPLEYLYISAVFHKTFLDLDEEGTEAAAATAVVMARAGSMSQPPKPIEVKVDHPFLFAIQHRASGACLFLGQVVDPR